MATFKANSAVDLGALDELGFLIDYTDHPPLVTSNEITIAVTEDVVEIMLNIHGSGFTKNGVGQINGGTIDGVDARTDGALHYQFTGLDIAIVPLLQYLKTHTVDVENQASQRLLNGDDTVIGSNQNDVLFGFAGADEIEGRNGKDKLFGGDDSDILNGGRGRDKLTGGADADTFVFSFLGRKHADKITDFEVGVDRIAFDDAIFTKLKSVGDDGALAQHQFHVGDHATKKGQRIIVDNEHHKMFYDPDGSGLAHQILVAKYTGAITYDASSPYLF
ncbi:MAG: hypothetical protein KDJ86_13955 [Bauldia sp.]|uniref:calcium-binding protein n=1 Tax=Bauldia sp. TaxID=2575872 RepID=UPI001D1E1076|nr:hypothetical protein [Bauldia sp.]MCB1496888.1 hypothetical protein [Bauldia sp.]